MVLEMAKEAKTLEERLLEVGERLASPPSSVDELYSLLDVIDSLVSRVEQSPSQSMLDALQPLMKALAVKDFLRHSDIDVKVAVASCISEITRITAPEAPYDDDIMKEIFQMIVGAFERLDDTSSRSYQKRVSILETVAKVRSCVVMLDLECDTLILQMFHHFLRTIRVDHPENVSSSMETIMTLVIEESEDISSELLSCLLDSLKKDNKDVPPVAAKLAEKVMTCCARKLKPYLLDSVQSTGALLSEYSKVVASICQENSDGLDHNGTPGSGELVVDDSKLSERTVSDELPQVSAKLEQEVGCPEKVSTTADTSAAAATSNGDVQIGNDDSMGQPSSPKIKSESSFRTGQSKSVEPDQADCDPESTTGKPVSAVDLKKGKGRKTKSSVQLTDTTDRTDCDKDVSAATSRRKGRTKEVGGLQINDASAKEVEPTVPSEPERNECQHLLESDNPTSDKQIEPVEGPPNRSRTKKRMPPGPNAAGRRSDADTVAEAPASASEQKDTIDDHQVQEEVMPSKGDDSEKEPDDADAAVEAPMGLTSDSDVKAKRTTGKRGRYKRRKVMERETLGKKQKSNMKQQKEEDTHEKDVDGETTLQEMASSPRSAPKAPREDETHLDDSAKPKSRRKRSLDAEEMTVVDKKELDERLVGSKIKVWWPDDKMFYEGVVDSYDPSTKMHTIVYTDGDVEVLLLKNERWESAGSDSEKDGDKEKAEGSASQMPRAKKSKANSNTTSKLVKSQQSKSGTETSSKDVPRPRGRPRSRTNLGKLSYDDTPGSSRKSKDKPADDGKAAKTPRASGRLRDGLENDPEEESLRASSKQEESRNKSRDVSSKASAAAKNDTSKVSGKSKDEPSKSSKRSKNDTPKSSARLKDDTPKSGGSKVDNEGERLKDLTPSRSEADEIKTEKTPRTKPKANSNPKTSGDLKANGIPSKGKAKAGDSLSTAAVSDSEATTGGAGGRKRKRKGRK